VHPSKTLAEDDLRGALRVMDADVQASLALTRAALHALAALSPILHRAADLALEEEAERAERLAAPRKVLEVVMEARLRLQQAPEEARLAQALERALVQAAEALNAAAGPADPVRARAVG
jgi:hypothetical protein